MWNTISTPLDRTRTVPLHDAVYFVVPADLIPVAIADQYKVASFAVDPSGTADAGEVVIGSTIPFTESQQITLDPVTAAAGEMLTVTGKGFAARSKAVVYFGMRAMTTTDTDTAGAFRVTFAVPRRDEGVFVKRRSSRYLWTIY